MDLSLTCGGLAFLAIWDQAPMPAQVTRRHLRIDTIEDQ